MTSFVTTDINSYRQHSDGRYDNRYYARRSGVKVDDSWHNNNGNRPRFINTNDRNINETRPHETSATLSPRDQFLLKHGSNSQYNNAFTGGVNGHHKRKDSNRTNDTPRDFKKQRYVDRGFNYNEESDRKSTTPTNSNKPFRKRDPLHHGPFPRSNGGFGRGNGRRHVSTDEVSRKQRLSDSSSESYKSDSKFTKNRNNNYNGVKIDRIISHNSVGKCTSSASIVKKKYAAFRRDKLCKNEKAESWVEKENYLESPLSNSTEEGENKSTVINNLSPERFEDNSSVEHENTTLLKTCIDNAKSMEIEEKELLTTEKEEFEEEKQINLLISRNDIDEPASPGYILKSPYNEDCKYKIIHKGKCHVVMQDLKHIIKINGISGNGNISSLFPRFQLALKKYNDIKNLSPIKPGYAIRTSNKRRTSTKKRYRSDGESSSSSRECTERKKLMMKIDTDNKEHHQKISFKVNHKSKPLTPISKDSINSVHCFDLSSSVINSLQKENTDDSTEPSNINDAVQEIHNKKLQAVIQSLGNINSVSAEKDNHKKHSVKHKTRKDSHQPLDKPTERIRRISTATDMSLEDMSLENGYDSVESEVYSFPVTSREFDSPKSGKPRLTYSSQEKPHNFQNFIEPTLPQHLFTPDTSATSERYSNTTQETVPSSEQNEPTLLSVGRTFYPLSPPPEVPTMPVLMLGSLQLQSTKKNAQQNLAVIQTFSEDARNITTTVKLLINKRPELEALLTDACKEILIDLSLAVKESSTKDNSS